MQVAITKEEIGFSAHIMDLHISTQWDSWTELIDNLHEAIELYYDEESSHTHRNYKESDLRFYLDMSHIDAANLQTA